MTRTLVGLLILTVAATAALISVDVAVRRSIALESESAANAWYETRTAQLESVASELDTRWSLPLGPLLASSTIEDLATWMTTVPRLEHWALITPDGRVLAPSTWRETDVEARVAEDLRTLRLDGIDPSLRDALELESRGEIEPALHALDALDATTEVPHLPALLARARLLIASDRARDAIDALAVGWNEIDRATPDPATRAQWREWIAESVEGIVRTGHRDVDRDDARWMLDPLEARRRERRWLDACRESLAVRPPGDARTWHDFGDGLLTAAAPSGLPTLLAERPLLFVARDIDGTIEARDIVLLRAAESSSFAVPFPGFVGSPWWLRTVGDASVVTAPIRRRGTQTRIVVGIAIVAILVGAGALVMGERQRSRVEARRRDVTAQLAHELRTPLAILRTSSETLLERDLDPERRDRYLRAITHGSQQLAALVDDVLALHGSGNSDGPGRHDPFDLRVVMDRVLTVYAPRFDQQRFEVAVTGSDQPLLCQGDVEAVSRALGCLIGNSLVHAAGGRYLGLDLRRNGVHAVLTVEDRGPGIPAEHREVIFGAYRRLSDALTSGTRGLGIGLTIARDVITEHGGSLTCEPSDCGARFVVRLPLTDREAT
ncbi:MAG: HAMP domain-containing histidine kinase [Planctomycetes bacterium]|nr:HAMP domain-containing histidine kinase [Planctomycetota bacterium]